MVLDGLFGGGFNATKLKPRKFLALPSHQQWAGFALFVRAD